MSVPVVTLAKHGGSHAHNVGVTLLNAVGLKELIAYDEPSFVQTVASLAADNSRLVALRASLRQTMADSPLCDGIGHTRAFEQLLAQCVQK